MGRETRSSMVGLMVVGLMVLSSGASADVAGETTRGQLAALKELCDTGLVSPEVCAEKQRDILGLTLRTSPPLEPGGVRASAPGAPRPTDLHGRARPALSAKPSGSLPAPAGRRDAPSGSIRESVLGFRMSLPDGWTSVSSKDMRKGFAVLADQVADNAEAKRTLKQLVDDAEIYVRGGEQLTVQARAGVVPRSAAEAQALCEALLGTLSQVAKRPLTAHECGPVEVAGVTTLVVDQEALVAGRRTLQVWVEKEAGTLLQFTMTCTNENATLRRKELYDIVASVRW